MQPAEVDGSDFSSMPSPIMISDGGFSIEFLRNMMRGLHFSRNVSPRPGVPSSMARPFNAPLAGVWPSDRDGAREEQCIVF